MVGKNDSGSLPREQEARPSVRCRPVIPPWPSRASACCWSISARRTAPISGSMWRYLREFLSDPRVIELSRAIWYPILYGLVLTTRPQKSGAKYKTIWNKARDESPLRTITRAQAERLAEIFRGEPDIAVEWGMRYGNPSIASAVSRLTRGGLRPHRHAAALSAIFGDDDGDRQRQVLSRADERCAGCRPCAACPPYYDEPVYIEALASSIEKHLAGLDFQPEMVVASYHGIPRAYFERGDPYHCHCQKTTRLLRERLGWDDKKLITTFQSRFGAQEWLQPYTDKTVEQTGARRRQVDRRRQSRLFRRLHRDAGRDRHARSARSSMRPAARISSTSPASTTATRAWR